MDSLTDDQKNAILSKIEGVLRVFERLTPREDKALMLTRMGGMCDVLGGLGIIDEFGTAWNNPYGGLLEARRAIQIGTCGHDQDLEDEKHQERRWHVA